MIYCVVPEEMADELYDRLANYYADDPNVKVIIDRRKGERRTGGIEDGAATQRTIRDRRRRGIPGEFPPIDSAEDEEGRASSATWTAAPAATPAPRPRRRCSPTRTGRSSTRPPSCSGRRPTTWRSTA